MPPSASTTLRLRPATPTDLPRLQEIRRRAFAPIFESFRTLVGARIGAVAFAEADREQAGLLDALAAAARSSRGEATGGEATGGDEAGGDDAGAASAAVDVQGTDEEGADDAGAGELWVAEIESGGAASAPAASTATPPGAIDVATTDVAVVGFVAVGFNHRSRVGEIGLNAVDPDHAGAGVAQRLYACALDRMRRRGMRVAEVATGDDPSHAPARRAYEKAGFRPMLGAVVFYREL